MKTLLISALAATCAFAQEPTAPTAPVTGETPAATTPSSATAEEYIAAVDKVISAMNDLTATLKGVTDKATADAAAPKVTECIQKLAAASQEGEALGQPSEEVQAKLKELKEAEMKECLTQFMGVVFQLATQQFYGSEALGQAMEALSSAGM